MKRIRNSCILDCSSICQKGEPLKDTFVTPCRTTCAADGTDRAWRKVLGLDVGRETLAGVDESVAFGTAI